MRQIILDTETTGLEPELGHRIIEIACVELIDRHLTGNNFHRYVNPQREIEKNALLVHGITNEFLVDKPLFIDIKTALIDYINGAELIIHNAPFDIGFLNHELKLSDSNSELIENYVKNIFDTLTYARKKHPGKKNSLDALCKRYGIDNSKRELHGALLDAHLLAYVYLVMTGGQMSMFDEGVIKREIKQSKVQQIIKDRKPLKIIRATEAEQQAHQARLEAIKQTAPNGKCLWIELLHGGEGGIRTHVGD
jgi:DNA polymerase-3 subunit epsilon